MARYRPTAPFNVPIILLAPFYEKVKGTEKKTFPLPDLEHPGDSLFFGSFRTFGGTEMTQNDLYLVVDTAIVETWYRPDITSDCRIYLTDTGERYEVVGRPENIQMRNQYLRFKVKKVDGGA